jgi:hypothetical protein
MRGGAISYPGFAVLSGRSRGVCAVEQTNRSPAIMREVG